MTDATLEDMRAITLDQLPVGQDDQRVLRHTLGVHGALYAEGKAVVWGPACTLKTEDEARTAYPTATLVWRRTQSKVQQALDLMKAQSITAHAAALLVGVEVSAVYRAQARREERGVCECCGQLLPP